MSELPLLLDQAAHKYSVGGISKPSVTELIKDLYSYENVPDIFMERARERGSMAHLACEYHDLNQLDLDSVDEVVMPYLQAYIKFLDETGFEPVGIERPYLHPILGVAGTPDRWGIFRKLKGKPLAVLELKTTAQIYKATGVQLSGYREILRANGIEATLRYAVQLKGDGTYKLQNFTDPLDDAMFHAMLTSHLWRKKHG